MNGEQNSADEEEWWTYCLPWICMEIAKADGLASDTELDDPSANVYGSNVAMLHTVSNNLPLPPGQVLSFLSASGGTWISREFSSFYEI